MTGGFTALSLWSMVRVALLFASMGIAPLDAAVGLLVGEPFGKFAVISPTGHAAVYLSRVCADSPVRLRRCRPGEAGVVISRYRDIGGYDWLAVPLAHHLFATEDPLEAESPAALPALLRERYRQAHLREVAPDTADGQPPKGDWAQVVGAAFDRTIYAFLLETTPEEDDRLIERLNSRENRRRFNLLFRNCANFAAEVINFYHPGAIRRSFIADFGILTPKQAAKSLVAFGRKTPGAGFTQWVVPQLGGAPRSSRLRGVTESLVLSKKYAAPLALFQPWVAAGVAAAYVTRGRFNPAAQPHKVCTPQALDDCVPPSGW